MSFRGWLHVEVQIYDFLCSTLKCVYVWRASRNSRKWLLGKVKNPRRLRQLHRMTLEHMQSNRKARQHRRSLISVSLEMQYMNITNSAYEHIQQFTER